MSGFPDDTADLTHILVVADTARSRQWYEEVLGAEVRSVYGTSVVLPFRGAYRPDDPERAGRRTTEKCYLLRSMGTGSRVST